MSLRKNTLLNLGGTLAPLLLTLFTIPAYLGAIGQERFGVLALFWLILGYFGLLDFGLNRATARFIAASGGDSATNSQIAFCSVLASVLLGLVGLAIFWPVAMYFFESGLKVDQSIYFELMAALPYMSLALPLTLVSSNLSGVLQGMERFVSLNIIQILTSIATQLLPLAAAVYWSEQLVSVVVASLVAKSLSVLLLWFTALSNLQWPGWLGFRMKTMKRLLTFGGWVTASSAVGPIITLSDRFLIGSMMNASAVTSYTVPYQLAQRGLVLSTALSSALFPRLASKGGIEARHLAIGAAGFLAFSTAPFFIGAMFFANSFLSWWISEEFASSAKGVVEIVIVGFWLNGLARIPYALLQAINKPKVIAIVHLLEVIPYLLVLYLAISYFGLIGAALIFTIRVAVDFILLNYFSGVSEIYSKSFVFLVCIIIISAIASFSFSAFSLSWFVIVIALISSSVFFGYVGLEQEVKKTVNRLFSGFRYGK